ncbi:MAG: HlyD family efflux transporter periplasmic adaptor subunit [Leptolyngbyaceae cyanobacterium SL_7_1]|nr:HlyD family efflux transporter periplasmic adaptor subunit [Leptolyngbyaceae cyanobacterium SL_7_1]
MAHRESLTAKTPSIPTFTAMKNLVRNGHNGKAKSTPPATSPDVTTRDRDLPPPSPGAIVRTEAFDQPVILQQSSIWSRGIVWAIVGVTSFAVLWASIARIEEAVPATGKLEPKEQVQEVQAPVGGVVQEILVEDGEQVRKNQVLMRFDPRATEAERQSLEQVRDSLIRENRFYRSQLLGAGNLSPVEAAQLNLPPEILLLTANRSALIAENQLYQTQLAGGSGAGLSADQTVRLRVGQLESSSRAAAAQLEVSQLERQLNETQVQLDAAQQNVAIDQEILNDIRPLEGEGVARLQVRRQEQQALNSEAEYRRLTQEQQRLQFAIAQAQQQLQNTLAVTSNDLLNRIADNNKRLSEIDSQLNKSIVENEKQIAEINSQLSQAELTLQYQELRAPIDGVVFDVQAKGAGFVANTSEPILKIVPDKGLVAQVFITNQDIGFVREGDLVDVRIDSFPFSEFGDVKGKLIRIGSDALPPDEIHQFYRFPAEISMDTQYIDINDRQIPLQSGMSVTANIITRDRTVISIFTDMFNDKVDSLRTVR